MQTTQILNKKLHVRIPNPSHPNPRIYERKDLPVKTPKSPTASETQSTRTALAEESPAQTSFETPRLSQADLAILKSEFTKDRLGVKVQSYSKDRTRAMLVQYLQHTDVQDRLEEVDPNWEIQVLNEIQAGDTVYVRCRLTLKGVSRENVGEGGDPKSAYSDALKRCAMLFGVGRYLYDAPTVWTEYDDSRDKFRQWSPDDYEAALRKVGKKSPSRSTASSSSSSPSAPSRAATPSPITPAAANHQGVGHQPEASPGLTTRGSAGASAPAAAESKKSGEAAPSKEGTRPREELNRILLNLYRPFLTQFPQTQFAQLLQSRYQVAETRLMSVEQLEDLVGFLESKLKSVA